MKQAIIGSIIALIGLNAQADGFKCDTESGLSVKVFNNTNPNVGTRVPAIMVVSDPSLQVGNRTIATFPQSKGVLTKSASTYTADVDLRMTGSRRSGELIGGTKLGELDQIQLAVDFSYGSPVAQGALMAGRLTLIKRNGDVITEGVVCERYLRN